MVIMAAVQIIKIPNRSRHALVFIFFKHFFEIRIITCATMEIYFMSGKFLAFATT